MSSAFSSASTRLTNDYINHFTEVAMMAELLPFDESFHGDLAAWEPRSYTEHAERMPPSMRQAALQGYAALEEAQRLLFDQLAADANHVGATVASAARRKSPGDGDLTTICELSAPLMRRLIARIARFIATGGLPDDDDGQSIEQGLADIAMRA
jgi:hypothetical protein